MLNLLYIFIGGGFGSVSRYLINQQVLKFLPLSFPIGTFMANIFGCFILGILATLALYKTNFFTPHVKLLLTVGFCGGLTTFSTFNYEIVSLIEQGKIGISLLYLFSSLLAGIVAIYIGILLAKHL